MKWRSLIIVAFVGLTGVAYAQVPEPPPLAPATQQEIEDTIEVLYLGQFPKAVGLSDDQLVKVLPLVKQWITMRRNANVRRQRLSNQLNQKMQRQDNSPEATQEIQQLIHDLDQTDPAALEKTFLGKIDPYLSPQQQGKLRIFQNNFDQRIRQLINRSRQGAPPLPLRGQAERQQLQQQKQEQKQEQKEQKQQQRQQQQEQKPASRATRQPNPIP